MTPSRCVVLLLALVSLAAGCASTADGMASSARGSGTTLFRCDVALPDDEDVPTGSPGKGDDELPMNMNNPGSIVERLAEDELPNEHLFEIPGMTKALEPYYDWKAELSRNHGLDFGVSFTSLYQNASDTFGPENDAASFDLDLSGTWALSEAESTSPTMLGFGFFWRDTLGTEIPAQRLFTQNGALYSNAAPYGENDASIGELWVQQKYDNKFGFRVGQIFPITAYDFFPFKNFRTDFVDFQHVTNSAIPLPGNGLGAFVQYRPEPGIMLRLGAHDANADVEKWGGDTYDGELFTILEAGLDIGLTPRTPGRPPNGHVHVSLWHQDERDDAGIASGMGIAASAVQRFGRFAPFVRAGYADVDADGPTPVKHTVNVGLVTDEIFGQVNDRIGVGYTWSNPADRKLDHQQAVDAYYRVQLTPEIQIGPTMEVIFDPVRNPNASTVYVAGFRVRIAM